MAKSTKTQTTAALTLTPDGRNAVDTLGRSNLVKRGPKTGAKAEPQLTPDGRARYDSLGRCNLNKRGKKPQSTTTV
jgi:hypothetical protein